MFGKRKQPDEPGEKKAPADSAAEGRRTPELPRTSPVPGRRGSGIMQPGISRRPSLGSASALAAPAAAGAAASAANEGRKLVVGREICLSGEIKACERLIVEGRVEADLTDSKLLEITEHGLVQEAMHRSTTARFTGPSRAIWWSTATCTSATAAGSWARSSTASWRWHGAARLSAPWRSSSWRSPPRSRTRPIKAEKAEAEAASGKAEEDADSQDAGESEAPKEAKSKGTTKMSKAEPGAGGRESGTARHPRSSGRTGRQDRAGQGGRAAGRISGSLSDADLSRRCAPLLVLCALLLSACHEPGHRGIGTECRRAGTGQPAARRPQKSAPSRQPECQAEPGNDRGHVNGPRHGPCHTHGRRPDRTIPDSNKAAAARRKRRHPAPSGKGTSCRSRRSSPPAFWGLSDPTWRAAWERSFHGAPGKPG